MSSELAKCKPEIYAKGHMVFMTHAIPARQIEAWVQKVAATSGQPVDWHYAGGRACVLALGDLQAVRKAIETHLPEHDALQTAEANRTLPDYPFTPSYTLYEPDEINTAHEFARNLVLERGNQ